MSCFVKQYARREGVRGSKTLSDCVVALLVSGRGFDLGVAGETCYDHCSRVG